MGLRFGTDGVRGVAGTELTPELVLALGRAAARVLCGTGTAVHDRPRLAVARDTRRSGPLLEAAFAAGVAAEGVEVDLLGVLPTPGLARVAASEGIAAAMVSASHNSFADNGIKLFGTGGAKLEAATERALEAVLDEIRATGPGEGRSGGALGTVTERDAASAAYVDALAAAFPPRCLEGLVVVVDCANGAASAVAPAALSRLGAWVEVLAAEPDGTNINDRCGSTHPEALAEAVLAAGADVGLALDGDADRVLAVDADGTLVDGDQLIALFADDLRAKGLLRHDAVAVTVMSNLGLRLALDRKGIEVVETPVGDKHVLEAMQARGLSLGGEQSGHIIFSDHAATGDGTFTGIALVDLIARSGHTLAELAGEAMDRLPQVLRNVTVGDRDGLADAAPVWDAVAEVEAELGSTGRVLLRTSGTEPLVRVMVEAPTEALAASAADRLVGVVSETLA
ncbi:MAG: phosphoglucosamine mutase [Acidimicrobiales bacterium]